MIDDANGEQPQLSYTRSPPDHLFGPLRPMAQLRPATDWLLLLLASFDQEEAEERNELILGDPSWGCP
jgi:hypothetical protein